MKKFFIVLGAIFFGLILLGIVTFVFTAIRGTALDKESKAYVDAAFPAIVSSWSGQELLDRASAEFKQATSGADVGRMFSVCRLLGKMLTYTAQGQALLAHEFPKGTTISASYVVKAQFERGSAEIDIKLIKHGDQWQILGFHVKPTYQTQRSNQAMQPAATRFTISVPMITMLPKIFTRGVVSRG